MWVYYRQTSNYCRPVLTYWPKDWRRQWLADCWSCTAFCCDSFSLLRQLCTVGHGIFLYGPCKQLFVSELNNAYFSRHLFWNSVWVAKSCITVCLLFKHCDFLNIDISQGSVATCLGYDGVFKLRTESNSERIPLKIGWHLAKFFGLTVYIVFSGVKNGSHFCSQHFVAVSSWTEVPRSTGPGQKRPAWEQCTFRAK